MVSTNANVVPPKVCPVMTRPIAQDDLHGGPTVWEVYCNASCAWWVEGGCVIVAAPPLDMIEPKGDE